MERVERSFCFPSIAVALLALVFSLFVDDFSCWEEKNNLECVMTHSLYEVGPERSCTVG